MSTELTASSNAYNLLRFWGGCDAGVSIHVSQPKLYGCGVSLSIPEISEMFSDKTGELFRKMQVRLELLDETMPLLRTDLMLFALTGGDAMVA